MKRSLGSSDSLGALMSMCPTSEEHSPGSNYIYNNSMEYQSVMDGLDEEAGGHVPEKKRRLSVNQVKALEINFEKENKLEPERKVNLAQELGLQPRQVAVWFQNRRARWKTKQLERDYGVLKSNFDALKHNYESLQHDNEALLKELNELRSKLQEENKSAESTKTMEANTINPPACLSLNGGSEGVNLKLKEKNGVILMADFKDGSSDSDSSAILNDDQSPNGFSNSSSGLIQNHQIFMSDSGSDGLGRASQDNNVYHPQYVKMEEHNFFGGDEACNFFSDEQAPTLHWYCPDQWN